MTSEFKEGKIQFVNIKSLLGKNCLLRNPWSEKVGVYRNGKFSEELSGEFLELATSKDEKIMIVPEGKNVADLELKVSPSQREDVWELNIKIAHKELDAIVGRH